MKYFLLLFIVFYVKFDVGETKHQKIKLSDLSVLTLHTGRLTNAKRSSSLAQLECVGGSAHCKSHYLPNVVQCKNMGSDGFDVQWKCNAELDSNLKFGHIDVNCEGYDYPDDPYVLVGSCGLRYTLDKKGGDKGSYFDGPKSQWSESSGNVFLFICICIIACAVIYYTCIVPNNRGPVRNSESSAPPPPGFRPEYLPQQPPPPAYEDVYNNKEPGFERPAASSGTGNFLGGMMAGGVLGYLFGNSGQRHNNWSSGTGYRSNNDFDSNFASTSSAPPTRRDSGEYRTSSGFGGTSRR